MLGRLRHMAEDAANGVNDDAVKEAAILRAQLGSIKQTPSKQPFRLAFGQIAVIPRRSAHGRGGRMGVTTGRRRAKVDDQVRRRQGPCTIARGRDVGLWCETFYLMYLQIMLKN